MSYDFWDYLPGALVIGAFILPIVVLIAFKIFIVTAAWFALLTGGRYNSSGNSSTNVRFNANDYDEDNY
jgi:hypothetical protein